MANFAPNFIKKSRNTSSIMGFLLFCYAVNFPIQNCKAPKKFENFCKTRKKPQESFVDCEDF